MEEFMQQTTQQPCEELSLGNITLLATPYESSLVVFTTRELLNGVIVLRGADNQNYRRPVVIRSVNGETVYAAVFSEITFGSYTMQWNSKAVAIAVEKGKITQIGLGVKASY